MARVRTAWDAPVAQHVEPGAFELHGSDPDIAVCEHRAIRNTSRPQAVELEVDLVATDPHPAHPLVLGNRGRMPDSSQTEGGVGQARVEAGNGNPAQRVRADDQFACREPSSLGPENRSRSAPRRGIEPHVLRLKPGAVYPNGAATPSTRLLQGKAQRGK